MKGTIWVIGFALLLSVNQPGICQSNNVTKNGKSGGGDKFGILKVKYDSLPQGDSLIVLHYIDDLYEKGRLLSFSQKSIVKGVYEDGAYLFKVPITKSFTYYTVWGKQPNNSETNTSSSFYNIGDYNYLVPGDSVSMVVSYKERTNKLKTLKGRKVMDEFQLQFTGKGSGKCKAKYYLDSLLRQPSIRISTDITAKYFTENDRKVGKILDSIMGTANGKDRFLYKRLCADVHFALAEYNLGYRGSYFRSLVNKNDSTARQEIEKYHGFLMKYFNADQFQDGFPKEILCSSVSYIPFLYKSMEALACFDTESRGGTVRMSEVRRSYRFFDLIVDLNNGEIRDRILVYYFKNTPAFEDFDYVVKKAIKLGQTNLAITYFKSILPVAGLQTAYNFKLEDQKGKQFELRQFLGKVVMMDFWFTGCGSCSDYFNHSLSKVEHVFKGDSNVVFISISADVNRNTWIKSIESGKYTSEYAINLYTGGKGFFHDVINEYKVSGCPLPVLIDKNGIIQEYGTPVLRNPDLLKERIKSLYIPSLSYSK